MIPKRWIEAYLRFLLTYRRTVALAVTLLTFAFLASLHKMKIHTDFFDFYPSRLSFPRAFAHYRADGKGSVPGDVLRALTHPPPDPYIKIYRDFRRMFGSANILTVILEVRKGDIYNLDTLRKLDRMTKFIVETKGVVPYQVLSIAHPKMKSINAVHGSIQVREVFYPGVPQTPEDVARVKFAVYATRGIRGVFVSQDDTAAIIQAGFWEEDLDFDYLWKRILELKKAEEDQNHRIYITGFPWLFASVMRYAPQVLEVFAITAGMLIFLLWNYFRTWTGIWVPVFSGVLSSIWGLAFGALLGFNLDPLVLVLPIFLTARAMSHSVQSMDRYHEEYRRLGEKDAAIVESYSHLFPPAIASIVTDGLGILIVAVAPIPLIQKVAIFASFWIVSIFVSVVTLHPIILSYVNPPGVHSAPWLSPRATKLIGSAAAAVVATPVLLITVNLLGLAGTALVVIAAGCFAWKPESIYRTITRGVIALSQGRRRWTIIAGTLVLFGVGWSYGRTLKVGDMTPGAALLFPDHPYNVAYRVLNEKFLGASQLIVIADTKRPNGMKDVDALTTMDEFADHMETAEGAGASFSIVDVVKQLARLYREGDPKWAFVPDQSRDIAELFYVFTTSGQSGDLDRFMDPTFRYGTVITLFHGYSHDIIMRAIERARKFAAELPHDGIELKLAGGLFGVLAAVNDAVETSYWLNLGLIFLVVYVCLFYTYGSPVAALILLLPVVLSQVICEAVMVIWKIDLNVNSLPIAAAGAGVGVDYGIYHFSRMIDAYDDLGDLDSAVDYATATTGKAIIFTATTMLAGTIFWWFSSLKFQAEMGLLLALLMVFNTFGGLVFVPALVKVIRPRFLLRRNPPSAGRQQP